MYDVVIIGGGPAGLSASLILGRARKKVLLCDAGVPRNAAAERVHGFVTQDGTPPREFRRVARAQLAPYECVETRDAHVSAIRGTRGAFEVDVSGDIVQARRILITAGVVDELPDTPGYRELWGKSVFQCPYCHGWEVRGKTFGYLAPAEKWLEFAIFLRGWAHDVYVFTDGKYELSADARERLGRARVRIEERRIRRLVARSDDDARLEAVEVGDGTRIPREVLFVRPPQRQTELVMRLEVTLDEQGFIAVDDRRETSIPGIYAAGDVTPGGQSAALAVGSGAQAAYMLNHELTTETALSGAL